MRLSCEAYFTSMVYCDPRDVHDSWNLLDEDFAIRKRHLCLANTPVTVKLIPRQSTKQYLYRRFPQMLFRSKHYSN